MQAGLGTGLALHPELLTHALSEARAALYACARQADSALAPLSPQAAALAILEAMHRFAVRSVLPFLPAGGLFSFPWLERAVWQLRPSLRPLSSPQGAAAAHTRLWSWACCACLQMGAEAVKVGCFTLPASSWVSHVSAAPALRLWLLLCRQLARAQPGPHPPSGIGCAAKAGYSSPSAGGGFEGGE